MSTKEEDERIQRRFAAMNRAKAKLWQAFCTYQEWQEDDGDPETFADWAKEELPNLMPVSGG